jgi:hypothetical protein
MTTKDRAAELADAVWVRLAARVAMIAFGVVGTVIMPTGVAYLRELNASVLGLQRDVALLRADWSRDQTADAGRFLRVEDRILDHERRLQYLERRP